VDVLHNGQVADVYQLAGFFRCPEIECAHYIYNYTLVHREVLKRLHSQIIDGLYFICPFEEPLLAQLAG
jgi:hypothetical protein